MIIVGIENCPACKLLKEAHPKVKYISMPRKTEDRELLSLKKTLGDLKVTHYPVIINAGMTRIIQKEELSV